MSGKVKDPRCPACGKRVRIHHPDIVLTNLETFKRRTYHAACGKEAAIEAKKPGTVHHFAIRRPDWSVN